MNAVHVDDRVDPYDMDAALDAHVYERITRRLKSLASALNRMAVGPLVDDHALDAAMASALTKSGKMRASRSAGRWVASESFGEGFVLWIEHDKSVVKFVDGTVRTIATRYLRPAQIGGA